MTLYKRIIRTALLIAAVTMLAGTVTAAAVGGAEGSGQTKVILGDANCDGEITIVDATSIQRYLVDLPVNGGFSEKAADVDGSGFLDITDATKIQRWLAGYYTPFPIGQVIEEPTEPTTQPTEPTTKPTEPTTKPTEPPIQPATDEEGWGHEIFRP